MIALRLHPSFLPAVVSVYFADVLLALLLVFVLLFQKPSVPRIAIPDLLLFFFAITVLTAITLVLALRGIADLEAALPNLLVFFYYGLFLVAISGLLSRAQIDYRKIDKAVKWVLLANLGIGALQLLVPPLLGPLVLGLYGDVKLRPLWTGYPRIYGAFANANWFGIFLVFIFCWFLCTYAARQRSLASFLTYSAIIGFLILVSGSRTALVGMVICFITLLVLQRRFSLAFLSVFVAAGATIAASLLQTQVPLLAKTIARFTDVTSGSASDISSFSGRGAAWKQGWNAFVSNPWGYGDMELYRGFTPHNSYLAVLLTFGLLGALILSVWVLWVATRLMLYTRRTPVSVSVHLWTVVFSAGFAAMLFAGEFFYTTQVMLLWLFLLALVWAVEANPPTETDPARQENIPSGRARRARPLQLRSNRIAYT